jgi:regulator of replication initiation timing
MYEELLTEVEEYRRVRVKSHNPGNNIIELGVQLKDFFPEKRELPRGEDKSIEEDKEMRKFRREVSDLSENVQKDQENLQRDYNRLLEEKEKLSRHISNCTEENRQLQLQNQELNTQLLAVLNEHYKMISQQLSENTSAESLAELKAQLSDSSVADVNYVECKNNSTHEESQPVGQTLETSYISSKSSIKEIVVNQYSPPFVKDSNRIIPTASLAIIPCEIENGKRRHSYGKSKRCGKYDSLLSVVGELSETSNNYSNSELSLF